LVPSESRSAYWAAFLAFTWNSGFSSAKIWVGMAPSFLPSSALVMPPVQAGMLPSLLAAFSPPSGRQGGFQLGGFVGA
jgi:hypothetical protein